MPTKTEAVEVFRQFAWSLAGKLAAPNLPAGATMGGTRRRARFVGQKRPGPQNPGDHQRNLHSAVHFHRDP